MENQYMCPHCRSYLKVGDTIVFKIRNCRREKGLLLIQEEGGYFSGVKHPSIHADEGERIDFYCPICMQSLDAPADENLVQVLMIDDEGYEHTVYFSPIQGKEFVYQTSDMLHLDH